MRVVKFNAVNMIKNNILYVKDNTIDRVNTLKDRIEIKKEFLI